MICMAAMLAFMVLDCSVASPALHTFVLWQPAFLTINRLASYILEKNMPNDTAHIKKLLLPVLIGLAFACQKEEHKPYAYWSDLLSERYTELNALTRSVP